MLNIDTLRLLENIIIEQCDQIILPLLNKTTADSKQDGSIVTEADLAMQQSIESILKNKFGHDIKFLGEECDSYIQQDIVKNEDQFWVLDPVDGTTNFHGAFPVFCTSLAFIKDNQVQLGITYDPIRKECFSALKGHGFFYNQQIFNIQSQQTPVSIEDCIAFIDFKRLDLDQSCHLIKDMSFKSQRNIGSSALEWAWLTMNRAQLTFHGGQKLWDYAAGSLMLKEAGGYCTDTKGQTLYQGSMEVRPIVAATSKALCLQWKNLISKKAN